MQRYFVTELYPHAIYTAGSLREDIETVLQQQGYIKLETPASPGGFFSKLKAYFKVRNLAGSIKGSAVVFFHFPLRSGINRYFFSALQKKGTRTIAYVHDLEGFRDRDDKLLVAEMKSLQSFHIIIAQNARMKEEIAKRTGHKKIIVLEMYDYLGIQSAIATPLKKRPVAFAGNLTKAGFIRQLDRLNELSFLVYGEPPQDGLAGNIRYMGKEDPRVLPVKLSAQAGFGLVWDGDSIEIPNNEGEYLQYNIPHKLAMYLAAELPVIVWANSAMAAWVVENQVGIVVNSLTEIKKAIDEISEDDYQRFIVNIKPIRDQMSRGNYLKKALAEAGKLVGD